MGMPLNSRAAIPDPLTDCHDSDAIVERLLAVHHILMTASYQYYFQTEWAHERAQAAVNGEELQPLGKAALLEDLMLG